MISNYIVQQKEQLPEIAQKFNISVQDILDVNNFDGKESLVYGQVIRLPIRQDNKLTMYRIREGDTLYKIASEHNTTPELLAEINGLKIYDYLYPGQLVLIPEEGYQLYITKTGDTIFMGNNK